MRRITLARFLMRVAACLPVGYPLMGRTPLREQPIFVLGSGRNGSTLLNRILNGHSRLFLPPEQYFLGHTIIKYRLYGFLNWRDLMKVLAGELMPGAGSHFWQTQNLSVLGDLISLDDKSLQHVVDHIYRAYGVLYKPFHLWGDTSPTNILYIREIFSLFPNARYVFLIRDGRDVVASHKEGGEHYVGTRARPGLSSAAWVGALKKLEWLQKKTPVHLVHYEQLVRQPELVIRELCGFLNIPFQSAMLAPHENIPDIPVYAEPIFHKLHQPIDDQSVGKWKHVLSEEELEEIRFINPFLIKYGYQ
ncbi:MAG: sulfotransferase [Cyclobacteriaceae bacterium]|nr:sulfotransferase [Cyclobacteriaceae bacterium]